MCRKTEETDGVNDDVLAAYKIQFSFSAHFVKEENFRKVKRKNIKWKAEEGRQKGGAKGESEKKKGRI